MVKKIYQRYKASCRYHFLSECILILLLASLWAQYVEHIAPCTYCLYQRYLFVGAMLFFLWPSKEFLGPVFLTLGLILSIYHIGLEQHWWSDVIQRCTTIFSSVSGIEGPLNLRQMIQDAPIVRCDDVNWRIYGLSATIWTMLIQSIFLGQYFWIKKTGKAFLLLK